MSVPRQDRESETRQATRRPPNSCRIRPRRSRELKLLYLSCGNKDGLINISPGVHAHRKQRDAPHIRNVAGEGHPPKTWASNLIHVAQRIFR